MKPVKIPRYRNNLSRKEVIIIERDKSKNLIQIEYVVSGYQYWYSMEDFNRLFVRVEDV